MIRLQFIWILALASMVIFSCKKQDKWLDVKRSVGDITPQTASDFQAILDYNTLINKHFTNIGLIGADNIYVAPTVLNSITQWERDAYLWRASVWDGLSGSSSEWNYSYNIIEFANIVLDGLKKIDPDGSKYKNLKGQALFLRSMAFYNLEQIFCKGYNPATAATDLGLPLRTTSDVNVMFQRSSLQQTFDQMTGDLKEAATLLDAEPVSFYRAGRYAAMALLSKIYLVMGDYAAAGNYANEVLGHRGTLLDFNSSLVAASSTYRFSANGLNNPEILFYAQAQSYNTVRPFTTTTSFIATDLVAAYGSNDLRRPLFFAASGTDYTVRGTYTGTFATFCGLAVNELYLIRAECYARQNNKDAAMDDINALLAKRYKTGTYVNLTAIDAQQALDIVLAERRKELPITGNQRWEDLKRLNKETRYQKTLTRALGAESYTLSPNSNAYALPIPANEIQVSNITQNPR